MTIDIPGKILIVDDERSDVEHLIDDFMQAGQGVIYLEHLPDLDQLAGVRLVVLDLDLDGDREVTDGDIEQAALILQKLSNSGCGFYLIAIWSKQLDNDKAEENDRMIEWLRNAYQNQTGHSLPSVLFLPPFSKKEVQHQEVMRRITEWIGNSPNAGLVFEWEKLLNRACDRTAVDILDLEGGSLNSLVKVLHDEVGKEADRGLIQLFNKVLLRYMTAGSQEKINELMGKLHDGGDVDLTWYARFHYFQAYYSPTGTDPIWTGDILLINEDDYRENYAVVITPQCDFAQGKVDMVKIAKAMRVSGHTDVQQQVFNVIKPNKPFRQDNKLTNEASNFLKAIAGGTGLPQRFYILRFICNEDTHFHLA